jgi:hypothetical protein
MSKPLTHPAFSTPAKVIYFVGWINPRPNHTFAAFLRFLAGSQTYFDLDLASGESRAKIAKTLEDHCKRVDWRTLEAAVSIPSGVSASSPFAIYDVPVILWPRADTLAVMKSPSGQRPGGGFVA